MKKIESKAMVDALKNGNEIRISGVGVFRPEKTCVCCGQTTNVQFSYSRSWKEKLQQNDTFLSEAGGNTTRFR